MFDLKQVHFYLEGEGQCIILMNGQFMEADAWLEIFEDLKRFYRVLIFDFPNQGKSFYSDAYDSIGNYCDFFIELTQKLHIDTKEAIAVGMSFGGNLIKALTLKCKVAFKAVILGGVGPLRFRRSFCEDYDYMIDILVKGGIDNFARMYYQSVFSPQYLAGKESMIEYAVDKFVEKYGNRVNALVCLIKAARSIGNFMDNVVEQYQCDVYLISARYDSTYVNFDTIEQYVKDIGVKHYVLDSGHAMIAENTYEFLTIVYEILEKYDEEGVE